MISKKWLVFSGDIPPRSEGEDLFRVLRDIVDQKTGLWLVREDVCDIQRAGHNGKKIMAEFLHR